MKEPTPLDEVKRSKAGKREMRKRLRKLKRVVGRWVATLLGETAALTREQKAIVRAHDRCDWAAVEEDLAPEDGS